MPGRADITGKLHLAELPVYALAIWGLSSAFGLTGVALAWVVRVVVTVVAYLATLGVVMTVWVAGLVWAAVAVVGWMVS